MFSSSLNSASNSNIPGSWSAIAPKPSSGWPKTLNPKFYTPETQPSDLESEFDVADQWRFARKGAFDIELQSLKEYSPPPSPACSSPLSLKIFSPEATPHEIDIVNFAKLASAASIEPHMTAPLLPDTAPLDFSCLLPQARLVMIRAAAPMASCCDFGAFNKSDENVLLHVMDEEFERLSVGSLRGPKIANQRASLLSTFKELVVGLSPNEYHQKYYWARYVHDDSDAEL